MEWISVRNWRRFQHYDPARRVPPWIKNNTELLHDSAYLRLTGDQRSMLHGLWLEYASARCRLPADPRSLARRLNLRVTTAQLQALASAGFIDFVASAALAEGYHVASARARATETEAETEAEEEVEVEKEEALDVAVDAARATGEEPRQSDFEFETEEQEPPVTRAVADLVAATTAGLRDIPF